MTRAGVSECQRRRNDAHRYGDFDCLKKVPPRRAGRGLARTSRTTMALATSWPADNEVAGFPSRRQSPLPNSGGKVLHSLDGIGAWPGCHG